MRGCSGLRLQAPPRHCAPFEPPKVDGPAQGVIAEHLRCLRVPGLPILFIRPAPVRVLLVEQSVAPFASNCWFSIAALMADPNLQVHLVW